MEDSNSNISTSSSTIDVASNKSSEEPVSGSGSGTGQRLSSSIDSLPSSTSISDPNVGGSSSNTSFHDNFSNGSSFQEGASSLPGNQSIDPSLPGDQPLDIGVFHPKRKVHGKDKKVCRVCGDKALGYNFNAMTCESCKAFFRRNALKQSTPNCMFQGNCSVDIRTRRFCPHCRLKKCFSMGMKKEMILDEKERRARMQKVAANRERRKGSVHSELATVSVKEEPLSDTEQQPDQSGVYYGNDSFLSSLSEALTHTPSWKETYLLETPEMLGTMAKEKDPNQYRTLVPAEIVLFEELKKSYATTLGEKIPAAAESQYNNANDLVNQSEVAVRKLIKFIKRMQDFQQLSQEDQIAALKAAVLNSLLLRSAFFYSVEEDAWLTPTGTIPTSILKKTTGFGEIHDLHTSYCRTLKEITGEDYGLFALLQIIVVFDPDGEDIQNKEIVSNIQDKYLVLLKHYLEAEFSFTKGQEYFATLMQKIADMKPLNECHSKILLQVNPGDIEPLMLEVLNLK